MTGNVKSSLPGERAVSRETETKAVIREFRRKDRPVPRGRWFSSAGSTPRLGRAALMRRI